MMSELDDLVKKYTMARAKKIKALCAPLNNCLGIGTFTYFRIENDGRFVTLSNDPEQLENYYASRLFVQNPFLVSPQLLRSGFVFTQTTCSEEYQATFENSYGKYQLDNPFLILQKEEERVEGYFFAGTRAAPIDYLNNFDLLKRFIGYFNQEAQQLISQIQSERFNLFREKGEAFLHRESNLPLSPYTQEQNNFLKAIFPLTNRELQCLDLFQKGHSGQATAAILGLSPRTVEHYFENIKNKLGCFHKADLLNR